MAKRKCVHQEHESDHECCIRLEQNAKQQAIACTSETHQKTRAGMVLRTTKDQTTEVLNHNGNAAGSEAYPANEPKWRRWHTNAFKQKVRHNLNQFHQSMSLLQFAKCELCHEALPMMKVRVCNHLHVCDRCHSDKSIPTLFSYQNNAIPGPVPECLSQLSVMEMLITQIAPMMQTYVLPFSQYSYHGHVISLPQDIQSFATSLPCTGKSVGMIVVKCKGKNDAHKDFRVRRDRLQEALLWLRQNNRYYSNIEVDYAALNTLPDNGLLPDLQVIEDDDLIQPADAADDIMDTTSVTADTESSDDDSNYNSDDDSDTPLQ